jgi:hypothetical protein
MHRGTIGRTFAAVHRRRPACCRLGGADEPDQRSYEPTRLTAGQAATTAPTRPCDQPWAMFAVRVAAIPSPSSQRAREGTGTRCRAAYSTTIELA